MKQLDSQNIIRLYEILNDPSSDKLYLVMPVADCGESLEWDEENNHFAPNKKVLHRMSSKATKLTPSQAVYYSEDFIKKTARSLISALDHLHNDLNIVHRDIKPANILMDEAGSPLLVDFGKAR
jgi:serine/threonine protein kinase